MSSAKPRKKKSQKAPETEEQKLARKAQQLQKDEERKKKKEEYTHNLLQETAIREGQFAAVNNLQIQHQWRKLMRIAKEEELKREIEVIAQTHEREVDRKDAIIAQLSADLVDIEAQFQTAIRSHTQHLDRFLALHRDRLTLLNADARREHAELLAEFEEERERRRRKHAEDRGELREVMDRMEVAHKATDAESKQEFQQQRQDIKDKNSEEFSALRIALDGKIDALELQFEQANKTYVEGTAQQTVRFKQLTEQDLQNAKTIEINARKLQRLQDSLNHWRAKMATNVRECEERNRTLKEEKDSVAAHFQELKGRMNRFREGQQRKLVSLTKHVDAGLREISRKVTRAEALLAVSEMNAKLETEEEALLALRPNLTQLVLGEDEGEREAQEEEEEKQEEQGETPNPYATSATTKSGKRVSEWKYLDSFFRRTNKVSMDNMALEGERERLQKENEDLKALLKQYLDGVSVNDDALRGPNPLFITQRAPTTAGPAQRKAITPQQLVLQYQRT